MNQDRSSGVLLHVTSLPSIGGIGDLGPAAYAFVDFLAAAGQHLWQVLPLGPTGYGGSPYSALSAFAGNATLISLEKLVESGWLAADRMDARIDFRASALPGREGPVDFDSAAARKLPLIEEAAANFLDRADPDTRARFQRYCEENSSWLADYAMYSVLRRRFRFASWRDWPEEFALRRPGVLTSILNGHARELAVEQAVQFFFDEQWSALRAYCRERSIRILGDVAIFVNYDSADVWTHPELFELDAQRRMTRVAGVPPDYFSATGQRWGNPVYRWGELRERHFDWWVARMRRTLTLYDMVRLDHFRGFEAYWSIPAEEDTAVNGQWVKAPGYELFQRLREVFGDLPFIAEDLGLITPEVEELRDRFAMPGMRILQFGFGDRASHIYLPHRFVPNSVVYTGTHDNNTTLGWWREGLSPAERCNVETYLGPADCNPDPGSSQIPNAEAEGRNRSAENGRNDAEGKQIVWEMIRAAACSVAFLCIFPLQDVLSLGSEARMNTPAAGSGNWTWRYHPDALDPAIAARLAALMQMTDRDGGDKPSPAADTQPPSSQV